MKPTEQSWNAVAKTMHWLIVLMVLVEVPVGYMMTSLYGPGLRHPDVKPLAELMGQIHHTNGFLLLTVMAARLVWRSFHPGPSLPSSVAPAQQKLARGTQFLLYALLFALPFSGWAALSALADSVDYGKTQIWFFSTSDFIPRLFAGRAFNDPYGYGFYARFHRWFIYTGALLLSAHVAAALWHHFVRRDRVLISMWPLATPHSRSAEARRS
jgi:cytochrome b561